MPPTSAALIALGRPGLSVTGNLLASLGLLPLLPLFNRLWGLQGAGFHALQIEINRALYVDERTLERTNGFARVRADMSRLAEALGAAALHKSLA